MGGSALNSLDAQIDSIAARTPDTGDSIIWREKMTAAEFNAAQERLGISRREFARRIGIAPNSATSYSLGRKPIPLTVALAIAAVEAGIGPRPEDLHADGR